MRFLFMTLLSLMTLFLHAQTEPGAGKWKTWFISGGKDHRLAAPPSHKNEIAEVLARQKNMNAATREQIQYWGAGAPGYRWYNLISSLWMMDTTYNGALANMLVAVAIYDATIVSWDTKYAYRRPRPFEADSRIKALLVKPESPSYPCEYSVAAGAAVTIISHFYPHMKDSVAKLATQLMDSRVAAGMAFPLDTRDGYALGKTIAETEIRKTASFPPQVKWDGKMPAEPGVWKGPKPMFPLAGLSKTVVLENGSEFRPAPPPDFAREMEEMKNFKRTFRSNANAYLFANESVLDEIMKKKIFEYNIHLNPPRAARIYAAAAIGTYDGFISCWDAKYAYWGIRPNQYDTSYKSLIGTPPFPGYPSGHAMISSVTAELLAYFFPAEQEYFRQRARDCAESRFQGGIHFRSDNEVALAMGKKVAAKIINRVKTDGAD